MRIDGVRVRDAARRVKLTISSDDVKLGANKNPSSCAAARACVRQLKVTQARVHVARVYVRTPDAWVRYQTPPSLRTEIVAFDRGGKFEPGEYVLTPPVQTTGKRQGSKTNQNSKKGPKQRKRPNAYHVTTGIRQYGANR